MSQQPIYLGWDLSTQQLKGIAVTSDLKKVHEARVDLDADFGEKYGIKKGVLTNPSEGEIFAPNAMWLEALDLVLQRLKEDGLDFSRVQGVSGAGMQHGTVFWSHKAEELLAGLKGDKSLIEQLGDGAGGEEHGAFSHPHSPNWQDASTQKQCEAFDAFFGSPAELANVTGSSAHHRFSGPQIMRFRQKYPEHYKNTSRVSLVSSFLASVFLGKFAHIDISDVTGMNLWHTGRGKWHDGLLDLATEKTGAKDLATKLGPVPEDGGGSMGKVSKYFVDKYGFNPDCDIAPFTGDNPSTILALPLQPSDAIVSLGTSTTFLMATDEYKPDPSYHFMNHPTTAGLYMFMLCYKNGSLAREHVRDALNKHASSHGDDPWELFNKTALEAPVLNQHSDSDPMKIGLYFPRPEIVPNVPAGEWHYDYLPSKHDLKESARASSEGEAAKSDARAIVESQMLSLRLRSSGLVHKIGDLPAQPRRVYLVGGGSVNPAIAQLAGEVLGGAEGVYRLDIGGNACALGAAYKACWAVERQEGEKFEDLVGKRWNEAEFVKKVDQGYRKGVFEKYGEAVLGFGEMEEDVKKHTARIASSRDLMELEAHSAETALKSSRG